MSWSLSASGHASKDVEDQTVAVLKDAFDKIRELHDAADEANPGSAGSVNVALYTTNSGAGDVDQVHANMVSQQEPVEDTTEVVAPPVPETQGVEPTNG